MTKAAMKVGEAQKRLSTTDTTSKTKFPMALKHEK